MTIHLIAGHARPSESFRKRLGILRGAGTVARMDQLMDDVDAIDALANLMTEAMETNQTKDGRVDMKDVAAHVLREMKRHQK